MGLKDTYNKIAKDWHNDHLGESWWIEGAQDFIRLFEPKARILDVGCGSGVKSAYLANHGLSVTGIDFSTGLIDIARKEVPQAEFLVKDMQDIQDLPMYEGIFAQDSLLHIPRAEIVATLEGLLAHLKDKGYLYITVKDVCSGKPLEEIRKENRYGYFYERFFSYFTNEEMQDYFREVGLEVIYDVVGTTDNTDWVQMIGKKI